MSHWRFYTLANTFEKRKQIVRMGSNWICSSIMLFPFWVSPSCSPTCDKSFGKGEQGRAYRKQVVSQANHKVKVVCTGVFIPFICGTVKGARLGVFWPVFILSRLAPPTSWPPFALGVRLPWGCLGPHSPTFLPKNGSKMTENLFFQRSF